MSFYELFKRIGINNLDKVSGLQSMLTYGWWWPFQNAVIITPLPIKLTRDDQNRLHNEVTMAIEYPDKWGVYAWHGVRVPKDIIMHPENITTDQILKESNQEIRRVMLERYGWGKLLKDLNAIKKDESSFGILFQTSTILA